MSGQIVTSGTVTSGTETFFLKFCWLTVGENHFLLLIQIVSRKVSLMARINDFSISCSDSENSGLILKCEKSAISLVTSGTHLHFLKKRHSKVRKCNWMAQSKIIWKNWLCYIILISNFMLLSIIHRNIIRQSPPIFSDVTSGINGLALMIGNSIVNTNIPNLPSSSKPRSLYWKFCLTCIL